MRANWGEAMEREEVKWTVGRNGWRCAWGREELGASHAQAKATGQDWARKYEVAYGVGWLAGWLLAAWLVGYEERSVRCEISSNLYFPAGQCSHE